tara:strand:- start:8646 stop:8933 length:288 start_codon:yes stop_codon:yes gene_type:complete
MIRTLTEWEFVDRMLKESFSYEGSAALFNYLEELEDDCGEQQEFDPVSLRCAWAEYRTVAECCADYGDDINNLWDLQQNTQVLEFLGGIIINTEF